MEQIFRALCVLFIIPGNTVLLPVFIAGQNPFPVISMSDSGEYLLESEYQKINTVSNTLRPGHIAHNTEGKLFVFNARYLHNIQVYDQKDRLIRQLDSKVYTPRDQDHSAYTPGRGVPVKGIFTHKGKYLWTIHYQKYGSGFVRPGINKCKDSQSYPQGYITRINTTNYELEFRATVGKVPEHITTSPNDRLVIVSNSCSRDIHIFDTQKDSLIKVVALPEHPADLAVDRFSRYVYITHPASSRISSVDLQTYEINVSLLEQNSAPLNLVSSPTQDEIFVSLSAAGKVARMQAIDGKVDTEITVETGRIPRAIDMTPDGTHLYVANYLSNTVVKIRIKDMKIISKITTNPKPISLSWNSESSRLYVASYEENVVSVYQHMNLNNFDPFGTDISKSGNAFHKIQDDENIKEFSGSTYYQPPATEQEPQPKEDPTSPGGKDPFSREIGMASKSYTSSGDTTYTLILGSFQERENAEEFVRQLNHKGINSRVLILDDGWLRVGYGAFKTLNIARETRIKLINDLNVRVWIKLL